MPRSRRANPAAIAPLAAAFLLAQCSPADPEPIRAADVPRVELQILNTLPHFDSILVIPRDAPPFPVGGLDKGEFKALREFLRGPTERPRWPTCARALRHTGLATCTARRTRSC